MSTNRMRAMVRQVHSTPDGLEDPCSWRDKEFQVYDIVLSPEVLLHAFGLGLFPWDSEGLPRCWWCPNPRAVLILKDLHISRSLAKTIRQKKFEVTFDQDFASTIAGCANREETWLDEELIDNLLQLHEQGIAHSAECWKDGELVGGVYGMDVDGIFLGDSMFSDVTDASKVALASLVNHLLGCGFKLMDCQVLSEHIASLGARYIPRSLYLNFLHSMQSGETHMPHWQAS